MMGQHSSRTNNEEQVDVGSETFAVRRLPDGTFQFRATQRQLNLLQQTELVEERNFLRGRVQQLVIEGSPSQVERISQLETRAERLETHASVGQVLRIRQLEAQLLQSQSSRGSAEQQRISELEAQVDSLEKEKKTLWGEVRFVKRQLADEKKMNSLPAPKPNATFDAQAREKLITEHLGEKTKLEDHYKKQLGKKGATAVSQDDHIGMLNTKLEHAEKDKKSRDDKIALLQSKVDKFAENQQENKKKTTELTDTITALDKAHVALQDQMDDVVQENGILRAEMQDRAAKAIQEQKAKLTQLAKERKEKREKMGQDAVEWKKIWKGVVVDTTGAQKKVVAEALERWMQEFLNL